SNANGINNNPLVKNNNTDIVNTAGHNVSANNAPGNNNSGNTPVSSNAKMVDANNIKGVSVSSFYPNPFYSNLNISLQVEHSGMVSVMIFDNTGKVVNSNQGMIEKGYSTIRLNNLGSLTKGIYYVKIITQDGTIST